MLLVVAVSVSHCSFALLYSFDSHSPLVQILSLLYSLFPILFFFSFCLTPQQLLESYVSSSHLPSLFLVILLLVLFFSFCCRCMFAPALHSMFKFVSLSSPFVSEYAFGLSVSSILLASAHSLSGCGAPHWSHHALPHAATKQLEDISI